MSYNFQVNLKTLLNTDITEKFPLNCTICALELFSKTPINVQSSENHEECKGEISQQLFHSVVSKQKINFTKIPDPSNGQTNEISEAVGALNYMYSGELIFVLFRHSPGKNMLLGVVGFRKCDSNNTLIPELYWNGSSVELGYGDNMMGSKKMTILSQIINNRWGNTGSTDFFEIGSLINNYKKKSAWPDCYDVTLNMFTYMTLMPWFYCNIGQSHEILGNRALPVAISVPILQLAVQIAKSCSKTTEKIHNHTNESDGINMAVNAANPEHSIYNTKINTLINIRENNLQIFNGELETMDPVSAMSHIDLILALMNKLLIEFDGNGEIYRNDNCSEDESIIMTQNTFGENFQPEQHSFFSKRDCEDCAQILRQMYFAHQCEIRNILRSLCAGLMEETHMCRILYLNQNKDGSMAKERHTLCATLYQYETDWCEMHLCENTCRQFIETKTKTNQNIRNIFKNSGFTRTKSEAIQHYQCMQWFGKYMTFELENGNLQYGVHVYTRFSGKAIMIEEDIDINKVKNYKEKRLVLMLPKIFLKYLHDSKSTEQKFKDAILKDIQLLDIGENVAKNVHIFYNEQNANTDSNSKKVAEYWKTTAKYFLGNASAWSSLFESCTLHTGNIPAHHLHEKNSQYTTLGNVHPGVYYPHLHTSLYLILHN